MKNFKNRGGGDRGGFNKRGGDRRGGFGSKSSFGNRGGGRDRDFDAPREMFRTTCTECGNSCEVPFRPTGDKPVLCNDCFGGNKDFGNNFKNQTRGGRDSGKEFVKKESDIRIDQIISAIANLDAKIESLLTAQASQPAAVVMEEVKVAKAKKPAAAKKTTKKKA
jgi:CxxC-x17-CxxC domain-containing protein